jgi:hypothetical protein
MKGIFGNISTFLVALALQVAVVWQDATAPLAAKLAATFVAGLGLAITVGKLAEVEQVIIAACTVLGTIGTIVLGHLSLTSSGAVVLSVALATLTQLRNLLKQQSSAGAAVKALLLFCGLAGLASCAWWQKHEPQFDCAAIATVNDAGQLIAIVEQCAEIATTSAAILPCIEGAAGGKWTQDILSCFADAQQGKATCPAFTTAKAAWKGHK